MFITLIKNKIKHCTSPVHVFFCGYTEPVEVNLQKNTQTNFNFIITKIFPLYD